MSSAAPLLAMMLIPAGQFGFLYFAALYTQGVLGFSPLATGLAWMSRLTPGSGYLGGLFGPFVLLGLGAGLTVGPLTAVIMHSAPPEHVGAASSLNQAMQQLGGATGLAVLSTVFAGTAAGSGEATGISTALTLAVVFPFLALLLFALWARPVTNR